MSKYEDIIKLGFYAAIAYMFYSVFSKVSNSQGKAEVKAIGNLDTYGFPIDTPIDGKLVRVTNRFAEFEVELVIVNSTDKPQVISAYIDWLSINIGIPPMNRNKSTLINTTLVPKTWANFVLSVPGALDIGSEAWVSLFVNGVEVDKNTF